jgi:hypothetical protein
MATAVTVVEAESKSLPPPQQGNLTFALDSPRSNNNSNPSSSTPRSNTKLTKEQLRSVTQTKFNEWKAQHAIPKENDLVMKWDDPYTLPPGPSLCFVSFFLMLFIYPFFLLLSVSQMSST